MIEKLKSIPQATVATIAYRAGLTGASLIALGVIISAAVYTGRTGERYSFLNHFVSELGEVGVAEGALVFNVGLFFGGLGLTIFMLGLAVLMQHWSGWVYAAIALYAGVNGMLVGIYSMDNLVPHIKVAMAFFNMGVVAMLFFTVYTVATKNPWFATKLAIPGGLTMAFFVVFLAMPSSVDSAEAAQDLEAATLAMLTNRPEVMPLAIFEWLIVVGLLAWVALVSRHLQLGCNQAWAENKN